MKPRPVISMNESGERLATYPSESAAGRDYNRRQSTIRTAIEAQTPIDGVWFRYADDTRPVELRQLKRTLAVPVRTRFQDYPTIAAAAAGEGVGYATMWERVRGKAS